MGWTVTRHKTGLYSLYSTVSDKYILQRVTRRRVIKYMALEFEIEYKFRVIEQWMTFPYGFSETKKSWNTRIVENRDKLYQFMDWRGKIVQLSFTKFQKALDARFQEVMQDIRKR